MGAEAALANLFSRLSAWTAPRERLKDDVTVVALLKISSIVENGDEPRQSI